METAGNGGEKSWGTKLMASDILYPCVECSKVNSLSQSQGISWPRPGLSPSGCPAHRHLLAPSWGNSSLTGV